MNIAPSGRITPISGTTTITGLRPTKSESPGTTKLPIPAEIPSVAISQPITDGSKPRTWVRNNGMNAQQITR